MKTCFDCGESKSREEFYKNKTAKDGLRRTCIPCTKAADKIRNAKRKDKKQVMQRRWYEANKEYALAQASEWAKTNKDKVNAANRKWKANHPEQYAAIQKTYRKKNYARIKANTSIRDGRKRATAHVPITRSQLQQKLAYYGGLCWICRENPHEHWDHVKPISKGGWHIAANLRPSCKPCNLYKRAKWSSNFWLMIPQLKKPVLT